MNGVPCVLEHVSRYCGFSQGVTLQLSTHFCSNPFYRHRYKRYPDHCVFPYLTIRNRLCEDKATTSMSM